MINKMFMSDLKSADSLSADFADSIGKEEITEEFNSFLNMFFGFLPLDNMPPRDSVDEGFRTIDPPPNVSADDEPVKKPPGDTPPIIPKQRVDKNPSGDNPQIEPPVVNKSPDIIIFTKKKPSGDTPPIIPKKKVDNNPKPVFINRSPDIIINPMKRSSEEKFSVNKFPGDTSLSISGKDFEINPKVKFPSDINRSTDIIFSSVKRGSDETESNQFHSNGKSNESVSFFKPWDLPPPPISPLETELPTLQHIQNTEQTTKYNVAEHSIKSHIPEPNLSPAIKITAAQSNKVQNPTHQNPSDIGVKVGNEGMEYSVEVNDFKQTISDKLQMETFAIKSNLSKDNLLNIQKHSSKLKNLSAIVSNDKADVQGIHLTDNFQKTENFTKSINSFAKVENSEQINLESSGKNLSDTNGNGATPDRRSKLHANPFDFGAISSNILEKFSVESTKAVEKLTEQMNEKKELVLKQIEKPILEFAPFAEKADKPQLLKLRLRPAELGEITVKLEKNTKGKLNIHFQTDDEAVGDVLVESFDKLRTAIQDSGWQVEEMEMSNSNFLSGGFNNGEENSQKERLAQSHENEMYHFDENSEHTEVSPNENANRLVSLRA